MKDQQNYLAITLRRGETEAIVLEYGPEDLTQSRYDLTGKSVEMRIKPDGQDEIVFESAPEIEITDEAGGEITVAIPGATIDAWEFQNAKYVILLDGSQLIVGDLTIVSLYE
ncbi:MAG: hypothetical protein IPN69_08260 [Acidobacteria bacterium]|nr:hypothetical protein [Acidobacteriota bacterium]